MVVTSCTIVGDSRKNVTGTVGFLVPAGGFAGPVMTGRDRGFPNLISRGKGEYLWSNRNMTKDSLPDFSHIQITKLPPGKAIGADDLTKWARNRSVGRSGSDRGKMADKQWTCRKCRKTNLICVHEDIRFLHRSSVRCRHCGGRSFGIGLRKLKSK